MSNNRNRIIFPAEYGRLQPQLAPAVQGGEAIYTLYLLRQDGTVYPIPAGATFEIVYQDTSDDAVYSTSTGITATDEEAGIVTWEAAAALGLAGVFWLSLKVNDDVSLRVKWKVEAALDASGVVPPVALTSLTAAQAALVAAIQALTGLVEMAAGSASGVAIQAFMRSFLGAANVIAARIGLLPSYTGNTGKVLAVNGAETDVEWVAQSGGDVASVFGRTGAVVAASGDYAASQVSDDSGEGQANVRDALNSLRGSANDAYDYIDTHQARTDNPHSVTAAQAGAQASDTNLTTIAGLAPSNDDIMQRKAGAWTVRTVAQYVTDILAGWAAHITAFLQSADAAAARSAIGAGTGNGDVTAADAFGTDNALLTADGTGKGAQSASTWVISNTGVLTGYGNINNSYAGYIFNISPSGTGLRVNAPVRGLEAQSSTGTPLTAWITAATSTSAIVPAVASYARASGTPGAGFGLSNVAYLESSTTNDVEVGRVVWLWNTATHASRVPDGVFYLTDYGGEREIWRGRANGTAAAIGFLGATPVARQAHIADASGDDAATVNAILDVLEAFGLVATS